MTWLVREQQSLKANKADFNSQIKAMLPWLMWAITISFVFFQFIIQLSSGVMVSQLVYTFKLNALEAGVLSSSFYLIYVTMQTPAGILVDRFGPKKLLSVGGLVCASGCTSFACSDSFSTALLGRVMMGAGASFAFVSALYIIGEWFSAKRYALMVGLVETFGIIGTLIANISLAAYLEHNSWRNAMLGAAVIALGLSLLSYLFLRDNRNYVRALKRRAFTSWPVFFKDLISLLKNSRMWFNGLYAGIMFSIVTVFAAFWGIPYYTRALFITLPQATMITACIFIGVAIGSIFMGWVFTRITYHNRFMARSSILAAFVMLIVIKAPPQSIIGNAVLMLCMGLLSSTYVFNYTLARQYAPRSASSTCVGFINTLCVGTAPLLQPLIGWLIDILPRHKHTFGIHSSIMAFQDALIVMPLLLIFAAIIALYIPSKSSDKKRLQPRAS